MTRIAAKIETLIKYRRVQDANSYLTKNYCTLSHEFKEEVLCRHFNYRVSQYNEPLMRALTWQLPDSIRSVCATSDALALDFLVKNLREEREKRA